jgi:hypothetical protein
LFRPIGLETGRVAEPLHHVRAGRFRLHTSTAPASKTGQNISKHGKDRTLPQCCYCRPGYDGSLFVS